MLKRDVATVADLILTMMNGQSLNIDSAKSEQKGAPSNFALYTAPITINISIYEVSGIISASKQQ